MTPAGRPPSLRVLMVASEAAPWAKTGGLGDVLEGLPAALASLGHDVAVVLPHYGGMQLPDTEAVAVDLGWPMVDDAVSLRIAQVAPRHRLVFVETPRFTDRPGYYGAGGHDYADNDIRFGLLARAALAFAERDPDWVADVVHAHDWQAGLLPAWLQADPAFWPRTARAARIFTIHNLAYQGLFDPGAVDRLRLAPGLFQPRAGEYWGQLSFLKLGMTLSDEVTTVSPTYAQETLTPAFGCGMEGVLASLGDRYSGILNGIDTSVWNPATDPFLPAHYQREDLAGKRACKRALLERFGLPLGDDALNRPVLGLVSRLVDQKGLDLLLPALGELSELDATFVFVGSGEARYEQALRDLAARSPARVGVSIGFSEALAHLVEAGADMFLMPSRFEPCGLNQMYSLRYGTVPIVRGVGGLDDTIRPYTARARRANGFKFRRADPAVLARVVRRAVRLFGDRVAWARLVEQGMSEDHSWRRPAREYVKVYRRARHRASYRDI